MLGRLLDRVRPGGTLLIVGLEPYELVLDRNDKDDRLVLEVEAVGDAAATVAAEPNYRELPERWISERIARTPSFSVAATERFPMRLTARSLQRQLVFARDCLVKIEDDGLRTAFEARVRALDKELSVWARKGKSHRRARNYAIVVRRAAQRGDGTKKPKRRFVSTGKVWLPCWAEAASRTAASRTIASARSPKCVATPWSDRRTRDGRRAKGTRKGRTKQATASNIASPKHQQQLAIELMRP